MERTTLLSIIEEAGLPEANAKILADYFLPFEKQANEWKQVAEKLVVTDVSQKAEMKQADEARKALVKVRTGIAKVHQELKANALKEGRLYDKIKNTLTDFVTPIEEHLAAQANFEKIQIENERKRIQEHRAGLLSEYMPDAQNMPLADMNQDAFDNLLAGQKMAYEARIEAERKSEEDRIAAEKAAAEKAEADRLELLRLKAENEAKEQELAKARQAAEKERKRIEELNRIEREKQEAVLKAEREERERIESELREKQEAEAAAEKQRLAEERKAKRAPDKVKLSAIMVQIGNLEYEVKALDFKDEEAAKIRDGVVILLGKVNQYIETNMQKM